jgi:hypothetical protein
MLKSRPTPSASQLDSRGNQPSQSARTTTTAWRTARLLIAPAALAGAFAFSCGDDDTVVGNTGGSGGTTSTGGSAGLGGSGGNGGSSVAGAAGSGGSAGSSAGAGGSAGTGNTAGAAGTAGTGGVANDPDAGDGGPVDTDSGTVQLTPQEQAADAQCAALDAVPSCQAPAAGCRQAVLDGWNGFLGLGCDTEVNAYENCLGSDPTAVTDCLGGSGDSPEFIDQTGGGCEDEQTTMLTCFG